MQDIFYHLPIGYSANNLDMTLLTDIVNFHNLKQKRYKKLENYYEGKHDILKRCPKNKYKPNNKVPVNHCHVVVQNKTGYFIGSPITFKIADNTYEELVTSINRYNNAIKKNRTLAKYASIYGVAYELLYTKNDNGLKICYQPIKPTDMTVAITSTIDPQPLFALRFYADTYHDKKYVDVYSTTDVKTYSYSNSSSFKLINTQSHFFNDVPVAIFGNNEEYVGDYEQIIPLQDAINVSVSNMVNELEYSSEAIIKAKNAGQMTTEQVQDIYQYGAVMLRDNEDIDFLIKPINKDALEYNLSYLETALYSVVCMPNWGSDNFVSSNLSGVAIRFRLLAMEQITSGTEQMFVSGLNRRYKIINNILNKQGYHYTIDDITGYIFTRNLPNNLLELAQTVATLTNIVSKETLLGLLPFVDNIGEELARIQEEQGGVLSAADVKKVVAQYDGGGVND